MNHHQTALRISLLNMVLNAVLAALKLTVGWICGSEALVSDGVHSVTDVFSSFVVLIGVRLSARSCDGEHPYGHERMECVAAVLLSLLIGLTGAGIGISGIGSVLRADLETDSPGGVALAVAIVSIAVKEIMFRYTRRAAQKSGSGALLADAWHMRTDALSSVGGFIGVLGANLGYAVLDPIAAVVISGLILKAAVSIFADAMRKMTDRSCDFQLQTAIKACVCEHEAVLETHELKTRLFGNRIMGEITVTVDGSISCRQAFDVARMIEKTVCERFEDVKVFSVHICPFDMETGCKTSGIVL